MGVVGGGLVVDRSVGVVVANKEPLAGGGNIGVWLVWLVLW